MRRLTFQVCGTREVGVRTIAAAHTAGVRRLAMEALPSPSGDSPEPIRAIPPQETAGGYLAQPDMRAMIATALDLGWTLWPYEARIDASGSASRPGTFGSRWATTSPPCPVSSIS